MYYPCLVVADYLFSCCTSMPILDVFNLLISLSLKLPHCSISSPFLFVVTCTGILVVCRGAAYLSPLFLSTCTLSEGRCIPDWTKNRYAVIIVWHSECEMLRRSFSLQILKTFPSIFIIICSAFLTAKGRASVAHSTTLESGLHPVWHS